MPTDSVTTPPPGPSSGVDDLSEALLLLSRMNQKHTEVLLILNEKGMITREDYSRIHRQIFHPA